MSLRSRIVAMVAAASLLASTAYGLPVGKLVDDCLADEPKVIAEYTDEHSFVDVVLEHYATKSLLDHERSEKGDGLVYIIASSRRKTSSSPQSLIGWLKNPENYCTHLVSPVSVYGTLGDLFESPEFERDVATEGRENIYFVQIDVKKKDMVALLDIDGNKQVDLSGGNKYRSLSEGKTRGF